jgi:hypothetical protein
MTNNLTPEKRIEQVAPEQLTVDSIRRVHAAFMYTFDRNGGYYSFEGQCIGALLAHIAELERDLFAARQAAFSEALRAQPPTDHEGRPITYWGGLAKQAPEPDTSRAIDFDHAGVRTALAVGKGVLQSVLNSSPDSISVKHALKHVSRALQYVEDWRTPETSEHRSVVKADGAGAHSTAGNDSASNAGSTPSRPSVETGEPNV